LPRTSARPTQIDRDSPLLPDFAASSRLYMRMLMSFLAQRYHRRALQPPRRAVGEACAGRYEPWSGAAAAAWWLSHRDGCRPMADARGCGRNERELFKSFDAVICPVMPTPAYPHEPFAEQEKAPRRHRRQDYAYPDQLAWPGIATLPGPAGKTAIPIGLSRRACRSACRSSGPWLEDRTPLKLAELIERDSAASFRRRR